MQVFAVTVVEIVFGEVLEAASIDFLLVAVVF